MRLWLAVLLSFSCFEILPAVPFVVDSPAVTITLPDGFRRNEKDTFGYVIVPPGANQRQKLRIHYTGSHGVSPGEASQQSIDRINQRRAKDGRPPEVVIFSKPVKTASGLPGQQVRVGSSPEGYLDHYYFVAPSGRIICVCVYYYGDTAFAGAMNRAILDSFAFVAK